MKNFDTNLDVYRAKLQTEDTELSLVAAKVANEEEGKKLIAWLEPLSPKGRPAEVFGNWVVQVAHEDVEESTIKRCVNWAGFGVNRLHEEQAADQVDVPAILGHAAVEALTGQPVSEAQATETPQVVEPSRILVSVAA